MTRIIAGAARGRRLSVPPSGTRPTSDRVREALFSSLDSEWRAQGTAWSEVVVLDLYAGSGALGLEALSRGARAVTLVERNRPAWTTLTANIAAVGMTGAELVRQDVARLPAQEPRTGPADLVLADPPYEVASAGIARLLGDLHAGGWIRDGALAVVERPARDSVSPLPRDWEDERQRAYGDTVLWYGRVPEGRGEGRG